MNVSCHLPLQVLVRKFTGEDGGADMFSPRLMLMLIVIGVAINRTPNMIALALSWEISRWIGVKAQWRMWSQTAEVSTSETWQGKSHPPSKGFNKTTKVQTALLSVRVGAVWSVLRWVMFLCNLIFFLHISLAWFACWQSVLSCMMNILLFPPQKIRQIFPKFICLCEPFLLPWSIKKKSQKKKILINLIFLLLI